MLNVPLPCAGIKYPGTTFPTEISEDDDQSQSLTLKRLKNVNERAV